MRPITAPEGAEFWEKARQTVFVSATPGDWEMEVSGGEVAEQVIRPTGVLDPIVEVRPTTGRVDDLLGEIRDRAPQPAGPRDHADQADGGRPHGLSGRERGAVRYLHSEIHSVERIEIIQDLRLGEYDVLVGVNLLREGLDLPEVSLVAILDADKEGFLRAERSDPDDWPGCTPRGRGGTALCRQHDRLDGQGD